MLSSLSTANPVTPPIFHLLGRGLGQLTSTLNFGAVSAWAPNRPWKTPAEKRTAQIPNSESATNLIKALLRIICRIFRNSFDQLVLSNEARDFILSKSPVSTHKMRFEYIDLIRSRRSWESLDSTPESFSYVVHTLLPSRSLLRRATR